MTKNSVMEHQLLFIGMEIDIVIIKIQIQANFNKTPLKIWIFTYFKRFLLADEVVALSGHFGF